MRFYLKIPKINLVYVIIARLFNKRVFMRYNKRFFWSLVFLLFSVGLHAKTVYNFDFIKKGVQDNNTLLVVGGIQGDEPGGFIAASLLATHYTIVKGSVWVVPNLNFYSIIKRCRGPYGDMNRKFAYLPQSDPEYETVSKIKGYIRDENVKLIVNLHDGSGFYREKYIDSMHSPYRWGQSSVIDQVSLEGAKYGNLKEISSLVVEHVNKHLIKSEDRYHIHNTKTKDGDIEMEKSLTYYAINQGKAAFGDEATKNQATHKRVYYHLLALEKYMDIMGIEFKRSFKLTPKGVYNAINNDIYISLYNGKIRLPLSKIKKIIKYFPIKKDAKIEFKASNPITTIIQQGNICTIQYGNRRLSRLKADYMPYDDTNQSVKLQIDGKLQDVKFGSLVDVKDSFLVEPNDGYRVNVIGYTNKSKKETGVLIRRSQIPKRFSIDKNGHIFRVEYYKKHKFVGMILVSLN